MLISSIPVHTSTVNGTIITTADLSDWDDCPKCVYGQVHLYATPGQEPTLICQDSCGFVSAPNL